MAISSKKMSAYILSGIVIAVVIISVVFISGIQFPHNGNTQAPITYGTLSVSITDAPVELAKLEVNIDSIEVQSQNSSWITLPFIDGVSDVTVDLLALQNISEDLSTTLMPTGNYTNIRLHVNSAVATYMDGSVENLNVPSDKINVIVHFEIKEATTTNVLLDMTADSVAISHSHNLKPVVKATVTSPTSPTPNPTPTVSTSPVPTESISPTNTSID